MNQYDLLMNNHIVDVHIVPHHPNIDILNIDRYDVAIVDHFHVEDHQPYKFDMNQSLWWLWSSSSMSIPLIALDH